MKFIFAEQAWADYLYWQQTDPKILKRINELLKEAGCNPTEGIGKPEPLRYAHADYWSRRITGEHRMVYK